MGVSKNASSLIFFAYWDRMRLPAVGREDVPIASGEDPTRRGRPKCTIINLATIIFSPLLLADKVADN